MLLPMASQVPPVRVPPVKIGGALDSERASSAGPDRALVDKRATGCAADETGVALQGDPRGDGQGVAGAGNQQPVTGVDAVEVGGSGTDQRLCTWELSHQPTWPT